MCYSMPNEFTLIKVAISLSYNELFEVWFILLFVTIAFVSMIALINNILAVWSCCENNVELLKVEDTFTNISEDY